MAVVTMQSHEDKYKVYGNFHYISLNQIDNYIKNHSNLDLYSCIL